jgi:hypothetical protein
MMRCGGYPGIYGGSKNFSYARKYFESTFFGIPRVLTVVLLENVIFLDIFKDSGQHFDLQLLKFCIPSKFTPSFPWKYFLNLSKVQPNFPRHVTDCNRAPNPRTLQKKGNPTQVKENLGNNSSAKKTKKNSLKNCFKSLPNK